MTGRYVKQCLCQACKAKQINIKPRDFAVSVSMTYEQNKMRVISVSIGWAYFNMFWWLKSCPNGGVKVEEYHMGTFSGVNMVVYEYSSIAEWARRVVARFETGLRLYSKRLGW